MCTRHGWFSRQPRFAAAKQQEGIQTAPCGNAIHRGECLPDQASAAHGIVGAGARAHNPDRGTYIQVLKASWSEFDLKAKAWTIPAERMKPDREHRVPLSPAAVNLLKKLERTSKYLFPGETEGKPLSNMAMEMCLRRMGMAHYTVHVFRSSFRDWVGEETNLPREVAEMALAHLVGSATERSYRHGDAFEKRRALMTAWANYCAGGPKGG